MKSVEVCLLTRNLSQRLIAMREWLDRHGFEPSVFTYNCNRNGSEVVARLSFRKDAEAIEFAKEMSGVVETAHRGQSARIHPSSVRRQTEHCSR